MNKEMTKAEYRKFVDSLYKLEHQAMEQAEYCEATYGEFSSPHKKWLDTRAALAEAIKAIHS